MTGRRCTAPAPPGGELLQIVAVDVAEPRWFDADRPGEPWEFALLPDLRVDPRLPPPADG